MKKEANEMALQKVLCHTIIRSLASRNSNDPSSDVWAAGLIDYQFWKFCIISLKLG